MLRPQEYLDLPATHWDPGPVGGKTRGAIRDTTVSGPQKFLPPDTFAGTVSAS